MAENSRIKYGKEIAVPDHMCFGRFVLDRIAKYKNNIALINAVKKDQITYEEMAQKAVNIASSLLQLGVKKGEVIAISSENRIEIIVTYIAVLCTEATVTIINSSYSKAELSHALQISKPKYMFLSEETYKKNFDDIKKSNFIQKFILFDNVRTYSGVLFFKDFVDKRVDILKFKTPNFKGETRIALILYSSGTTGLAKGAKLSHKNLCVAGLQKSFSTLPKKFLSIAPWSSCMGIMTTLDEILDGRTMVFLPRFNERVYLQTIQEYKIGILSTPPPLLVTLCKSTIAHEYDISTVEIIVSGGAPLNPGVMTQLKNRYPNIRHILQGYGMTECSGALTREMAEAPRPGSVGQITTGITLKVVDIETRKILGPDEVGEVCVKGTALFEGYIGKSPSEDRDEDGFYKTGDIAYYDKDGYFYIVDRLKELIKYKAWQVAPSEIEALLLQHPAVKDTGVAGAPDDLAGELPTAFIVKQPNKEVTKKEIIDFVASKVSPWKRLTGGVIFVDEIPKNPSGKILRRKLRDMLPKTIKSKI